MLWDLLLVIFDGDDRPGNEEAPTFSLRLGVLELRTLTWRSDYVESFNTENCARISSPVRILDRVVEVSIMHAKPR
jgi:hypothetical protein